MLRGPAPGGEGILARWGPGLGHLRTSPSPRGHLLGQESATSRTCEQPRTFQRRRPPCHLSPGRGAGGPGGQPRQTPRGSVGIRTGVR